MKSFWFIRLLFFVIPISYFFCSCNISQVYLRHNQEANGENPDGVVLYMDKFGNLYPDLDVSINEQTFYNYHKRAMYDTTSANLEYYFTSDSVRLDKLRKFYHVSRQTNAHVIYSLVQDSIIDGYAKHIRWLAKKQASQRLVFLIHGFNDSLQVTEYKMIRDSIAKHHYPASKKPLFIEVYWDGLIAIGRGNNTLGEARIWPASILNSCFVGLSLRKFIYKIESQDTIPIIMITHSLGAAVATGALFNTNKRYATIKMDPAIRAKLDSMMKVPTPTVSVRLGMLAPAIPGMLTFADFDQRSPADIKSDSNNIKRVVIGYNQWDYATTKDLFGRISLARWFGSTTLGCNYYYRKDRSTEIERVFQTMKELGYNSDILHQMIYPIRFNTSFRPGSRINCEHIMPFYIEDHGDNIKRFLDALFEN